MAGHTEVRRATLVEAAPVGCADGGVVRGPGRLGKRQATGLPEHDELSKPAEDAPQDGHDEGMQGRVQPAVRIRRLGGGAHGTELIAQGG